MDKEELIHSMIRSGALKSELVIHAFETVKRENFCLPKYCDRAYLDQPLPIIANQTISQPTTVAIMTEALELKDGQNVLEIGAGSGYQASIIAEIIGNKGKIYTIERIPALVEFAKHNIERAGYMNVEIIHGDGSLGLKNKAPFDRIIVTACSPRIPKTLKEQLKIGGKLIIPVGKDQFSQDLTLITKIDKNKFSEQNLGPFVFVPLIGKEGWKEYSNEIS